jgi:hypothetical protein
MTVSSGSYPALRYASRDRLRLSRFGSSLAIIRHGFNELPIMFAPPAHSPRGGSGTFA